MASTRPRRSAALEAQVKVEESYEIWGQPPPKDEPKRVTAERKRSATADASASRKRRRTSVQLLGESGSLTVLPKIEAEGETLAQPVKRGPGRPRKNSVRRQTPVEVEEPTKKITLRVPSSPAFKEALRQISAVGNDARPSAGLQSSSHAGFVKGIIGDVATSASTQANTSDNNTDARSGPGPASFFEPDVSELPSPNKTRSEFSVRNVQGDVPDSEGDTQLDTSNPRAETIAARSFHKTTMLEATDVEVEGAPSKLETRRGSNHLDSLERLEASATIRETQRLATRSSVAAPTFVSEHTQLVLKLSSSTAPPRPNFAGTREMQDPVMSSFVYAQQKQSTPAWTLLAEDTDGINELATQMEQETPSEERAKISAHLDKNTSSRMRETLAWNGVDPLLYHFRTRAAKEYSRQKTAAMSYENGNINAATSSPTRKRGRVSNEYASRTLTDPSSWPGSIVGTQPAQTLDEGKPFSNEFFFETQRPQVLHGGPSSFHEPPFETQAWHAGRGLSNFTHTTEKASHTKNPDLQSSSPEPSEWRSNLAAKATRTRYDQDDDSSGVAHKPIHATPNLITNVGGSKSDVNGVVLQHKPVSVHPPPMNRETPNIYFDRSPNGSSIGAHSFDPLVGLVDHSDPRTFHIPNSKDWPYVLAALQPSIDHFRQLTDGAEPREMPLDSGYEVAHTLLQAHLRSWFVINRPDYAHNKAIPKIFKLERWEGGIEHWKFASNSPVRPTAPARPPGSALTPLFPPCAECTHRKLFCSGFRKGMGGANRCNACVEGGINFRCSEPLNSANVVPVQQNYPPCNECARDNMYCYGFQKDIRNRCEVCLERGQICSYDMAQFEDPVQV